MPPFQATFNFSIYCKLQYFLLLSASALVFSIVHSHSNRLCNILIDWFSFLLTYTKMSTVWRWGYLSFHSFILFFLICLGHNTVLVQSSYSINVCCIDEIKSSNVNLTKQLYILKDTTGSELANGPIKIRKLIHKEKLWKFIKEN